MEGFCTIQAKPQLLEPKLVVSAPLLVKEELFPCQHVPLASRGHPQLVAPARPGSTPSCCYHLYLFTPTMGAEGKGPPVRV